MAREERVDDGVALLAQAMADLVRQGLARRDDALLHELHRRLVDAQAPGLGVAVARLADETDPERLVLGLGRLQLLCDAWRARERLPPALQADVRAAIGIPTPAQAVHAHADTTRDEWCVLGQVVELDDKRDLRTTRTWLRGTHSGRTALHLDFAAGMNARRRAPSPTPTPSPTPSPTPTASPTPTPTPSPTPTFEVGTSFDGTLAFWPSALPQRALVVDRLDDPRPLELLRLPGRTGIREWLADYAALMARQPFLWRALVVLGDVRLGPGGGDPQHGQVVDGDVALPFGSSHALMLYALTGGHAHDLVAEWDGRVLRPLAVRTRDGFSGLEGAHA